MTQYDAIGSDYDVIKTTFHNRIEKYNIRRAVKPFLQNPNTHVLDLACGTGFYSHLLLEWGASSVTGVDISQVMVDMAVSRLAKTKYASKAHFIQGDGSNAIMYAAERDHPTFDLVTGFWLLNYAKDVDELTQMFHTILTNLKHDGVFIGVCLHPSEDVASFAKAVNLAPDPPTELVYRYGKELDNRQGYHMEVQTVLSQAASSSAQGVQFSCQHLKQSLFEVAARGGGMNGNLEWRSLEFLDDEWTQELGIDKHGELWTSLKQFPQMAIVIISKE